MEAEYDFSQGKRGAIDPTSLGKTRITIRLDNEILAWFREQVHSSTVKAEKLAPVVRGWRNYHRFCKMDGSRHSLYFTEKRAFKVFNKEAKKDRHSSKKLLNKAFPSVPYSGNKWVNVKGEKSPYDGDLTYWSERNSKLYNGTTSKALKRQNHKCGYCGMKMTSEEKVHLHHVDGNHDNWKSKNLLAVHQSCHQLHHTSKPERREPDAGKPARPDLTERGAG
ncbi:MAG: group II intron maturase-specific domain-containing protein [Coleofasciculus sp. C2-GNP5-27]